MSTLEIIRYASTIIVQAGMVFVLFWCLLGVWEKWKEL